MTPRAERAPAVLEDSAQPLPDAQATDAHPRRHGAPAPKSVVPLSSFYPPPALLTDRAATGTLYSDKDYSTASDIPRILTLTRKFHYYDGTKSQIGLLPASELASIDQRLGKVPPA